jgi:anhydro-N-acetylmuramic acid kinase
LKELNKETYHVLGIMSGTSLDGIDIAEINLTLTDEKVWDFEILDSTTEAYSSAWREKLQRAVLLSEDQLVLLNIEYTEYLSEVIHNFINKYQIENLDAICSHGHTILHQPNKGLTLQIGNLPKLATFLKQKVVCDFRVQDVQLGGQGAPLVPIGDALLFGKYDYCLNLGGFANISFDTNGRRLAFDICPVNIVLNIYAENLGFSYDDKGGIAASGVLNMKLLKQLNELQFYSEEPPKSLGLEWVRKFVLPILDVSAISFEDKLRTMVEHIAIQISSQIENGTTILVTGGGVYNEFLMSRIQSYKNLGLITPSSKLIEFKEALIFGLLGVLRLRGSVNCLASVTGAKNDHSSGNIYFG